MKKLTIFLLLVLFAFGCTTIQVVPPEGYKAVVKDMEVEEEAADEDMMEEAAEVGAATKMYGRDCINSPTSCSEGYGLNDITGMADGDTALVPKDPTYGALFYEYNDPDVSAQDLPDVVVPDSGTGRWLLRSMRAYSLATTSNMTVGGFIHTTGASTAASYTSTGSNPMLTVTNADCDADQAANPPQAGRFCYDSALKQWLGWHTTPNDSVEFADTTTAQDFENKTYSGVGMERCITINDPVDADNDVFAFQADVALTVTRFYCIVVGGTSMTANIKQCTSAGASCTTTFTVPASNITCDSDGAEQTAFSNGAVDANDWLSWGLGVVTGSVEWVTMCVRFDKDLS
jgi:hypothetical protein